MCAHLRVPGHCYQGGSPRALSPRDASCSLQGCPQDPAPYPLAEFLSQLANPPQCQPSSPVPPWYPQLVCLGVPALGRTLPRRHPGRVSGRCGGWACGLVVGPPAQAGSLGRQRPPDPSASALSVLCQTTSFGPCGARTAMSATMGSHHGNHRSRWSSFTTCSGIKTAKAPCFHIDSQSRLEMLPLRLLQYLIDRPSGNNEHAWFSFAGLRKMTISLYSFLKNTNRANTQTQQLHRKLPCCLLSWSSSCLLSLQGRCLTTLRPGHRRFQALLGETQVLEPIPQPAPRRNGSRGTA